jgi:hypothetical protein
MVDERGEKMQMVEEGKWKYEITTSLFSRRERHILDLLARVSYFRSISKTVSIHEDLSHRSDLRTCCSRRDIRYALRKFVEKLSAALGFLSCVIAFYDLLFRD